MNKAELLNGGLDDVSQAALRLGLDRNTFHRWNHQCKVSYTRIHGLHSTTSLAGDGRRAASLVIGKEASQ